jgi:UV excision repair protein RAD23
VCMVSKPKAKPAPAPVEPATPAPASTSTSTPAAPIAPIASSSTQPAAPSTPTPQRTTAPAPGFNDPSNLTIGAERAEAIANMEAMGFERAQIDRAMRAAFFNPERAVEYLISGIPESAQQEARQAQSQPAVSSPAAAAGQTAAQPGGDNDDNVNLFDLAAQRGGPGESGAPAGGLGEMGGGALEFLRTNPQFQQLRQVVQQNPQMLEPLLQQLGAGNPAIAQMIANNPEQFLEILSEEAEDDAPLPPGAQSIEVTAEERDAIERLCRLGFDRNQAIQAYFACDKNEELAANFLFDQPEDEDPASGI